MIPFPRLLPLAALTALLVASVPATAQSVAAQTTGQPEGVWTGTLRCAENAILCDSEDIVIRIVRDANPLLYDVDINAVDNGHESLETHIVMIFGAANHVLTARLRDDRRRLNFYALAVKGDNMAGVLLVDDRYIERTFKLTRSAMPATPQPAVPTPVTPPPVAAPATPDAASASSSSSATSSASSR